MWGDSKENCGETALVDGIAILTLSNPPANTLTADLRKWLVEALGRAEADPAVRAIVLIGAGAGFSVGVFVDEYDTSLLSPDMAELCDRVETCTKPVICALHGPVLAGGFELALAAHYRVAHSAAVIGFPEVKLGLVPAGGGTQRAPRLIGARASLDLLLSGVSRSVTAPTYHALFDQIVSGDLRAAALRFALDLPGSGKGPRPTRDREEGLKDIIDFRLAVEERREQMDDSLEEAPREAVNCVEASVLLPFDAGMEFERAAFESCIDSPQSIAMRQAYYAERRAARIVRPKGTPINLSRVAVMGAGPRAAQLTVLALGAGLHVSWGHTDSATQATSHHMLGAMLDQAVTAGFITAAQRPELAERVWIGSCEDAVDEGNIILDVVRGLDVPSDPAIPRLACDGGRHTGVSFRLMPPLMSSRLAEIVQGPDAQPDYVAAAMQLADRLKKLPVLVKSPAPSVSDRMMAALHRGADALVDQGLSPYQVDAAISAWGWQKPPFQMRDALGLQQSVGQIRVPGAHNWSKEMMLHKRQGRAAEAGFYDYTGGTPRPSRLVQKIVDTVRPPRKAMSKTMAQMMMVAALANEGARILSDGWVTAPCEVDLICMYVLDYPRFRGGPMTAADIAGLPRLIRAMERFDHVDRPFWTPAPLLQDLAEDNRTFASMNG